MFQVYFMKTCKASLVMATLCLTLANCTLQSESRAVAQSSGKSGFENLADTSSVKENVNGILVMAHGGGKAWNKQVEDAVLPLREEYPVAIAFGMADAASLQEGFEELESKGVENVAVVRLFVSGDSWRERTAKILGLVEGAPEFSSENSQTIDIRDNESIAELHSALMSKSFWKVESSANIGMSAIGLSAAEEMEAVIGDRIASLSEQPASEDVVVIAHGPSDDEENLLWISRIQKILSKVQTKLQLHDVSTFTLREDWPEKREDAEFAIRRYVREANLAGRTVLVIPFRVSGFGPYAELLRGLDYRSNGLGLLPHKNVTLWIKNQAQEIHRRLSADG
jgi:sirohydrochlorin ferrochelatase